MALKQLGRVDAAGLGQDLRLPGSRYGFGVSWDAVPGRPTVDIDLQCVVVDNSGQIIDCAYYNNLKAVRAITHSGDEPTGAAVGIDEVVWVNVPKLPDNAAVLVFVVAAYSGGCLRDVVNGKLHLLEESARNEVACWDMEQSSGAVDVVGAMFRSGSGWSMRVIEEPAQQGQHFMDILPLIADIIRVFIPNAPRRQKVAFAMEKGAIMDLPQDLRSITIGVGWDTDCGEVDLDVSAVLLDTTGSEVETVFFGRLESEEHGVMHTGDNLTGEGDGDDEQITVNLGSVGPRVSQIAFVINIYTPRVTFQQVANPYCRVVDNSTAAELCRYSLAEAGMESGLIVSKIAREAGGRWGFHALGLPCRGRTYKDSLPQIRQVCQQDTKRLLARGDTRDLSGSDVRRRLGQAMPFADVPTPLMHRLATPLTTHQQRLATPLTTEQQQSQAAKTSSGQAVLVLRSDGTWSPGKITESQHGAVTVAFQNGVHKHIPANLVHSHVRMMQSSK